jgi:hypothetical protein
MKPAGKSSTSSPRHTISLSSVSLSQLSCSPHPVTYSLCQLSISTFIIDFVSRTLCGILISHRQHYQKLRKESRTANGGASNGTPSSANGTPAKATPTLRKRARKHYGEDDDDDDDDEEPPTPSKRKRAVKKEEGQENGQSATLFKMEDLSGNSNGYVDLENDE